MGKVGKKTDDKIQKKKNPPQGKVINKTPKGAAATASSPLKKEKKANLAKTVKNPKIAGNSETNSRQGHKLITRKRKNDETEMDNEEENNVVHALSDSDLAEEMEAQMTSGSDTDISSEEEDEDYDEETEVDDGEEEEEEEDDVVDDDDDAGEPKKKRCKKSPVKKNAPKKASTSKSNYAYDEPQIESKIDTIDMPRKKQVKIFDQAKWSIAKAVKTSDVDVDKWLETHTGRESYFFGEDEVGRNVYTLYIT